MPRRPREKCENSIYHVIVRGNNQGAIFLDDNDRDEYLKRLKRYKEKFKVSIYAYCLMTNHVHLLIYDNGQDISKVMQGLSLSYVIYFNKKYGRTGHLFQDRFNSVMVKRDSYFIYVSKYIHLNPVRANMVKDARNYKWGSYNIYINSEDEWEIIEPEPILDYFSIDYKESRDLYKQYIENIEDNEASEEVATAIETSRVSIKQIEKIYETSNEQILQTVECHFGVHRLNLTKRNNRKYHVQRDICIYIVALAGRNAYNELTKIFYVQPPAIGVSIKRAINLMISNEYIYKQVNEILQQIA